MESQVKLICRRHHASHGEPDHFHLYAVDAKTGEYIQDLRSPFYSRDELRDYVYEHCLFDVYYMGYANTKTA